MKDALPIEGFEEVAFVILTATGELNFEDNPLIVTGSPMNIDSPQKQTSFIPLVSQYAIKNANKPLDVFTRRTNKWNCTENSSDPSLLKVPKNKQFIEKTSNQDKVGGNNELPLDVILQLCKKSIPENGNDPGFFFETKSGFKFQSLMVLLLKAWKNLMMIHTKKLIPIVTQVH